jgi:hypothetical protein
LFDGGRDDGVVFGGLVQLAGDLCDVDEWEALSRSISEDSNGLNNRSLLSLLTGSCLLTEVFAYFQFFVESFSFF